jgi:tight adherence protein B
MPPLTSPLIIATTAIATMVALISLVWLVGDVFFRRRSRIRSRLNRELGDKQTQPGSKSALFKDLNTLTSESASSWTRPLRQIEELLIESGLPLTRRCLMATCVAMGLLGAAAGAWFGRSWWLGAAGGVVAALLPLAYVRAHRRRRKLTLCRQLPEAFEIMARALRAGQTIAGAFQIVARDMGPPLGEEFTHCYEQQNLGRSSELALRDMARRCGVMELQMFVVVLLVQRRSGGNVVELLNNLADVVRKRIRLQGKVRAATGEARLQAVVLLVLPVAVFISMYFLNRDYAQVLLSRPKVLAVLAACQAMGTIWIRHIVNFEF